MELQDLFSQPNCSKNISFMCVVGEFLESEFSHFLSESVPGNIHWFFLEVPLVIVVIVIWQLKNAENLHLKCIRIFRNQGKKSYLCCFNFL